MSLAQYLDNYSYSLVGTDIYLGEYSYVAWEVQLYTLVSTAQYLVDTVLKIGEYSNTLL